MTLLGTKARGAAPREVLWAALKHVSGSKAHVSMMVGRGGVAPLPDPVALRIIPDGAGVSMLRLDKAGTSIAHTWHATLAHAKASAASAFGVADEDWTVEASAEGRAKGPPTRARRTSASLIRFDG